MIGMRGAWLEQRRLGRKPCCHRGGICQVFDRDQSAYERNASLMRQCLANADIALPVRRELGPILRERQIEIDFAF